MSILYWFVLSATMATITYFIFKPSIFVKDSFIPKTMRDYLFYAFSIVFMLSPFYYEFPDTVNSIPVTFEGSKVVRRPWGMFHSPFSYNQFSNLPLEKLSLRSEVKTVTENPKVKTVSYTFEFEIFSPKRYFSVKERRRSSTKSEKFNISFENEWSGENYEAKNVEDEIRGIVRNLLYAFNKNRSKSMALLTNPRDIKEHAFFNKLSKDFLNPRLEKDGIRIINASFKIN